MKRTELIDTLDKWDAKNRRVFTTKDLRRLFPDEELLTFRNGVTRFSSGDKPVLKRAARGVFIYSRSKNPWTHVAEELARTLRRGFHTYISLESALSEYGVISQIPMQLTLITTGRPGEFKTAFGTLEFVHTRRDPSDFVDRLVDVGRPLRMANKELALEDLRRNNRNMHLVQEDELDGASVKCESPYTSLELTEEAHEPVF